MSDPPLFPLPVEVRRCSRNPKRLVIVSATGRVLLRTLGASTTDQDTAERFARAMNEWARSENGLLQPWRFGLSRLKNEVVMAAEEYDD